MAEITKQARRRGKAATEEVDDTRSGVEDEARDSGSQAEDEARSGNGEAGGSRPSGGPTITSELKDTFRDATIEVLRPVMRKATTAAAKYAVTQGPTLVKDKVMPKVQDAG